MPSWVHKLQGVADLAQLLDQVEKPMARFLNVEIDDKGQPQAAVACRSRCAPSALHASKTSEIVYKCVELHAEDFRDSS